MVVQAGDANARYGGAGTVVVVGPASTYGDLTVDNGGLSGQATVLPALGSGEAQGGSGGSRLVTERTAVPAYFVGHWVEVSEGSGPGLRGTWRIAAMQTVDGKVTLTLAANSGSGTPAVQPGDRWQGVYRFDSLTVKGKAKADIQDRLYVTGTIVIEPGSSLVTPNWEDPSFDLDAISVAAQVGGTFRLVGQPGAVLDPNQPIHLVAANQTRPGSESADAAADGSFSVSLTGQPGDVYQLTATDTHNSPRSAVAARTWQVPVPNQAPVIEPSAITARQVWKNIVPGGFVVEGAAGAITDANGPILVRVLNASAGDQLVCELSIDSGASFECQWPDGVPNSVVRVTATDSDPVDPQADSKLVGELPARFDFDAIRIEPLGLAYQVIGGAGAILEPDHPATVELINYSTDEHFGPFPVAADGSFYGRMNGCPADGWLVSVDDGDGPQPQVGFGPLPEHGFAPSAVDLGGRSASRLRRGYVALDSGTAVGELEGNGLASEVLGGLGSASDAVFNVKLQRLMALDGGDLVGWVELGSPPVLTQLRTPLSSGQLVLAQVRGEELYVVAEEADGIKLLRFGLVVESGGAWNIDCGLNVPVTAIPGTSGRHALELLPGPGGKVAILTDDPLAELQILDASREDGSTVLGAVDLAPSASAPEWATWETGELIVGRVDGTLEVWRWSDTGLVPFLSWQTSAGVPHGAARFGDQLLVGLDNGDVVQLDVAHPASVIQRGEESLGEPIVSMSRSLGAFYALLGNGQIRRVDLYHMPPTISAETMSWGWGAGASWVYGYACESGGVATLRMQWADGVSAELQDPWPASYVRTGEVVTRPTLHALSWEGARITQPAPDHLAIRAFEHGRQPQVAVRQVRHAGADCQTTRGVVGDLTGCSWVAAGARGLEGLRLEAHCDDGQGQVSDPSLVLPTQGPLVDVTANGRYLIAVDDGVALWDVGQLLSSAQPDLNPVTRVGLTETQPLVVRMGSGRLLLGWEDRYSWVHTETAPALQVLADGVQLPGLGANIVDLDEGWYRRLFALAEGSPRRVCSFDVSNPATPTPVACAAVPAGPPAIALGHWDSCDAIHCGEYPNAVNVVRQGWGVSILDWDTLQPVAALELPGNPVEAFWNWRTHVALREKGYAVLVGPPGAPAVSFVDANATPPGNVVHLGEGYLVTPEGVVR